MFILVAFLLASWLVEPASSSGPQAMPVKLTKVQPFYASTSFWNTPIAAAARTDPNSANMVSTALAAYASRAVLNNDDDWGMGYAYADATSKTYTVACNTYCTGDTIVFSIPAGAQPSTGSDHHLAVLNGNQELDMWDAHYNSSQDIWSAGVRTVTELSGHGANCAQGRHCNSAVAAGFALLGGAVRPEEIAQGHIDHALSLTTPATRADYIACPATHTDGQSHDSNAIPEGARVQLDPAFDVDGQSWSAWQKTIAHALQTYGAYVSDTSGALALYAVTDRNPGNTTWASVGMKKGPSLSFLPWKSFRVLEIHSCN